MLTQLQQVAQGLTESERRPEALRHARYTGSWAQEMEAGVYGRTGIGAKQWCTVAMRGVVGTLAAAPQESPNTHASVHAHTYSRVCAHVIVESS